MCKQWYDMSNKWYSDKHNDSSKAIDDAGLILNLFELITNQEYGDKSIKTPNERKA